MKVFISWSGTRSQAVAEALKEWLPSVIQAVEPWLSSSDIYKGTRWSAAIANQLEQTSFGIICLTSENLEAPWILFEAGALSKLIDNTFVCPYLLDVETTDLQGPLTQFQATKAQKEDTRKLIHTINEALREQALLQQSLDKTFEKWWPDLETRLKAIPNTSKKKPQRTEREMIEEMLEILRVQNRATANPDWLETLLSALKSDYQNKYEQLREKYKQVIFKGPTGVNEFTASEVSAVKIGLMNGVQHSVYAVSIVEPFLPLPLIRQDDLNYFRNNKRALERIRRNHPSSSDIYEYTIHRVFVISKEALLDIDIVQKIKSAIDEHCRAGFDIRISMREDLVEPPTYEFAIYDNDVVLRIVINHLAKSYGEGVIYFDEAVVRDVYSRKYKDIEAESYIPNDFWERYLNLPE